MGAWPFFLIGGLIVGADAAPFTSRTALKTAVDNCLAVDATGVTCCATADCGPAGSAEMKDWDVSSVTNMNSMFNQASAFNADLSSWDVSSVTTMGYMFYQASVFNADLSSWNVSSVTTMYRMFHRCHELCHGSAAMSIIPSWYLEECPPGHVGVVGQVCTVCLPGTWQGYEGRPSCIACLTVDRCPGGFSCADGHTGEGCYDCDNNFYMLEDVCYPCKQDARFFGLLFLGLSVFVVLIAAVAFPGKVKAAWKRLKRTEKYAKPRIEKLQKEAMDTRDRASKFGAIIFLLSLITFLQIQTLVVSVRVPWPRAITALFEALNDIVNFDAFGVINPECSFRDFSQEFSWLIRLCTPVVILFFVAGGTTYISRKSGDTLDGVIRLVVQVLHVTFVGNTVHALLPLDCAEYACIEPEDETHKPCYDGKHRVMESMPEVVCSSEDSNYVIFLACSISGFILYVVAYVAFIAYVLRHIKISAQKHKDYVPSDSDGGGDVEVQHQPHGREIEDITLEVVDDVAEPMAQTGGGTSPVKAVTAGPVIESNASAPSIQPKAGTDTANSPGDEGEDEELDSFERVLKKLHPVVQRQIARYGVLILPYSQRAWAWELVSMVRKTLMALTAVFYTTKPIMQLELMLSQNVVWLVLLLWFRPFCAVPFMGGPLERLYEEPRLEGSDKRWSSGNIVEICMASGTVALSAIGLSVGDGDPAALVVFFFAQLLIVGMFVARAIVMVGEPGPFFGPSLDRAWESIAAQAEKVLDFILSKIRPTVRDFILSKIRPKGNEAVQARWRAAKNVIGAVNRTSQPSH